MWLTGAALLAMAGSLSRAQAEPLPWLQDPWKMEQKVVPYQAKLQPSNCPPAPVLNHKLRMNEVVVTVLCHNPDTKSAFLSLLADADTLGASYSAYFPEISASLSASRSGSISAESKSKSISRSSGISASWTLYDFGQREMTLENAERGLAISGLSYSSTMQGVIASSLGAYFSLLTAQNALDVARESERYAKESFEAASLKHKLGLAPLVDKLQAKTSYEQFRLSIEQAENQLALAKASLASLMGLPVDSDLQVAELNDSNLTVDPFSGKVRELIDSAKQRRVDLKSKQLSLENAKTSLRALKRGQLATVSASADMGLDDIDMFNSSTERSQSIGVSVSIPIFNGFQNTYNRRVAEINLKAQEQQLQRTELDIEKDVLQSWNNYQTAKQSWDISWDQIATASQLKNIALGRYKEGVGSILEVLNAQNQYRGALQSQLTTRLSLLTTRIDLVRAVGVLNLETMSPHAPAEQAPPAAPENSITP